MNTFKIWQKKLNYIKKKSIIKYNLEKCLNKVLTLKKKYKFNLLLKILIKTFHK